MTNEQEKVRLALFGPGGFGAERARAMHESPSVDFAACYSPISAEKMACQNQYGAKAVESPEDIWDDNSIEGVVISTPNHKHLELVSRAAACGKHVFVEKPITPTLAQGREMIEHCKTAGVLLMVGHNSRRRERVRKMKQFIEDGTLGIPIAAEMNNSHAGGLNIQTGDWRWSSANCPGGPLIQLGIHHADTLLYLLGPVLRVSAWQRRLAVSAEIADTTMTMLEFKSGALGYIGAMYVVPALRYYHILGTQANVRWDRGFGLVLEQEGSRKTIPTADNDTIREEIDEFAGCIRNGGAPEVDGEKALMALALIEAAVLSNQRGRPVEIAEILGSQA
jgi:predicted dehydrogenase